MSTQELIEDVRQLLEALDSPRINKPEHTVWHDEDCLSPHRDFWNCKCGAAEVERRLKSAIASLRVKVAKV